MVKEFILQKKQCEKHFVDNTSVDKNGRFIVSLSLRDSSRALGDSQHAAIKRSFLVEKKLSRNAELKVQYDNFL